MIGKAHQRIIREKKSKEISNDLFGNYWDNINTDIDNGIIKQIDYQTAKKIILEYEWLGTMGTTQYHYGIFFDGNCAGVVCYGYFQAMNVNSGGHPYAPYVGEKYAKQGIQLSRGACVHWSHKHTGSKLIGTTLRLMNQKGYKYVIAFSDPEAGEIGTLYQATNWYYLGSGTTKHYNIYFKHNNQIYLDSRDIWKKHKIAGKRKLEEWLKDENRSGLYAKVTNPKSRYIYLLGNKKEKKEMIKTLKDKIKPYPKRT